jgi:hypothetical protein
MNLKERKLFIIIAIVLVSCICLSALAILAGALVFFDKMDTETPGVSDTTETSPWVKPSIGPTQSADRATPTPFNASGYEGEGAETYETLANILVPIAESRDIASRFLGLDFVPEVVIDPDAPFSIGDRKVFWASNTASNEAFQVEAELAYETPHVYFWIERGLSYNANDLKLLVDTFETDIYPTNREFFGSENTPGIDDDVHLYILYSSGLGDAAGYYSSSNSESPLISKTSNAHEMFFLNADYIEFDEQFTYEVLAHEFQHMIHDYQDKNEVSWINEGFSELAAYINGYDPGNAASYFFLEPDMQLTDWPYDGDTYPHYGSSFLFMTYFLDRFGEDATKALVADPKNDMQSVDEILAAQETRNAATGEPLTGDDVFADWVVANIINQPGLDGDRYHYRTYTGLDDINIEETLYSCPQDWQVRDVHQYGADYISIKCEGTYTLSFEGQPTVKVVPQDAHSGDYAFWSNKGDNSDMWMQQTFDLTGVSGDASFTYWTWYQIEKDYDYLYLLASTDGKNWDNLKPEGCTDYDPVGNSYGCAYNDESDGWVKASVDLSEYAGKSVTLRFEYITDEAVNAEGMLIDDVSIDVINYTSDFESDAGGWETGGFVRIVNILPQTYRLSLISIGNTTTVEQVVVQPGEAKSFTFSIGGDISEVVLSVSGTARFTRQIATYRYKIQ